MNTPTDKELRDWYMGYGVEGRAELAEVEGEAFDRYMVERDARVAKATEQSIIELLESGKHVLQLDIAPNGKWKQRCRCGFYGVFNDHLIALIKMGEVNNYTVPTNKVGLFIYNWREWGFKLAWSMLTRPKTWEPVPCDSEGDK